MDQAMAHAYDILPRYLGKLELMADRNAAGRFSDNLHETADRMNLAFVGKEFVLARRAEKAHCVSRVAKHIGKVFTV
jgi:hypothetical protein